MSIIVKEVTTNKELKAFINLPYRLYKDHPYYVPPLSFDEMGTLRKDKNPAFDYCEAKYFLAYKEGRVVGRIAAILNHAFIEKWKNKYMRFGWIDFEEDIEIPKALLGEVEKWAKEKQMDAIHGPMGFTDLDHEGMLVQGFDQLGTLAAIYNYAYYPKFMEELGFTKDADWVEYKIRIPKTIPPDFEKMASIVKRRLKLTVVQAKKPKEILPYTKELFELINSCYSHLYGVVPLTDKQIDYYTKQYFSFIKTEFVPLIIDENGKLIAFGVTMPSLSKALQKAKGSLLPFGLFHLLGALKKGKNNLADLYLVAVDKAYQGKGVNALIMYECNKAFIDYGMDYAESNPELEVNEKVQAFWDRFDAVQHKRRRAFIKRLDS
jgi:GNAT superfamily N-acetyltransferase